MRKRIGKKTLKRTSSQRKALLRVMSTQLVIHEHITTTESKAKFLRPHVEKLITKAKKGGDFNNVKFMKKMLDTSAAVEKILSDVGPRFRSRPGGYTRIVKTGNRAGDNAPMARIEFVQRPSTKKPAKKVVQKEAKSEEEKVEKKTVKNLVKKAGKKTDKKTETKKKVKKSTKVKAKDE